MTSAPNLHASDRARSLLESILEKCDQQQFLTGEIVPRDWSVEAEVRNGADKAKVTVWYNAKGQLTPKIQGKKGPFIELLETFLYDDAPMGSPFLPATVHTWIGVDESGKGDYFGGLVTAAVMLTPDSFEQLRGVVLRDSKQLDDRSILRSAEKLRSSLGEGCTLVSSYPERYNEMLDGPGFEGNTNRLLAWQHARSIENLLERFPETTHAISDQFAASEHTLKSAMMKLGKGITLVQRTKAEADPAVAAASILARAGFLHQIHKLEELAGCRLPLGATDEHAIRIAVRHIREREGLEALRRYAKIRFKTTQKVV